MKASLHYSLAIVFLLGVWVRRGTSFSLVPQKQTRPSISQPPTHHLTTTSLWRRTCLFERNDDDKITDEAPALDEKLWDAVRYGELDEVQQIVKDGANVNVIETDGWTPLHEASNNGDLETVRFLVNSGADVDCKDMYENTPLHYNALCGHTEIVRFLVSKGADLDCKSKFGCTPLQFASCYGHIDAAFVLMDHGANLSIEDTWGDTSIDVAQSKDVATRLTKYSSALETGLEGQNG
jgi:ankyrin repeat protein